MKVFVAVPVYTGDVCHEFCEALLATMAACVRAGIGFQYRFWAGNCYVEQARNLLVTEFLKTDCTDFFFIDADLMWDPDRFVEMVRLKEDIVGGAYPYKVAKEDYPIRIHVHEDNTPKSENGLICADALATGFLRIKRHVIEKMKEKHPEWTVRSFSYDGKLSADYFHLFRCEQVGEKWWGEDYNFCRKAKLDGYSMYCMPDITFAHIGRKQFYGNYNEFLMRQPGGAKETME